MQTKKQSVIETIVGVAAGYITAIIVQIIVFPWFNIDIDTSQNMLMALIFTVVSLIRSYVIRRLFNRLWK